MKFTVLLDGRPVDIELTRNTEGWRLRFTGENGAPLEKAASLVEVEPGVYSVLLEGRSIEARVERGANGLVVDVHGQRFAAEVRDPRRTGSKPRGYHAEGRQRVAAPMPGKVVRVLVGEGDEVRAGQGLLVVEAMKMQNELKSPKPGRVAALRARQGAAVAAGEVLAEIE